MLREDDTAEEGDGKAGMGRTGLSNDTQVLQLTPPPRESSSVENMKLFTSTRNWSDAARRNGLKPRSSSEPRLNTNLLDNAFFKPFKRVDDFTGNGSSGDRLSRASSVDDFLKNYSLSPWKMDNIDKLREDMNNINLGHVSDNQENVVSNGDLQFISPIRIPPGDDIGQQTLGLECVKRALNVSPTTPQQERRKVSIGEGSSPLLRMNLLASKMVEGSGARGRAYTVGSPYARTSSIDGILPAPGRERGLSTDRIEGGDELKGARKKKVAKRSKLAAKFHFEAKQDMKAEGNVKCGRQRLISEMFQNSPKRGNHE